MTVLNTAPSRTYTHPLPGDAVHFWAEDPPPLSRDYVQPPCGRALIARTYPSADGYVGSADLVIVTSDGIAFIYGVPRIESYAEMHGRRSYGVPASWHVIGHEQVPS